MKIPNSAFAPMLQMVIQSLPYEKPFEPSTPESNAVIDILQAVTRQDPDLKDIEGFIYSLAGKIDDSPKKQESMKILLLNFKNIIDEYMYNSTPP